MNTNLVNAHSEGITTEQFAILREEARRILVQNDRGGYTVPNADVYPFQWNWDSLFVALGWLTFDEQRAWQEIEKLFEGQWENGLLPSIVFHHYNGEYFPGPDMWQAKSKHGVDTTGITQIPIVVAGLEMMYRLTKDRALAEEKMSRLFAPAFEYQQWFYRERAYRDTGLCQTFHGWESMDNSPLWDTVLARVTPTTSTYTRKDKNHVPEAQRPKQWDYDRYISILEQLRRVTYNSRAYEGCAEMSIIDAAVNGVLQAGNKALLRLVDDFGDPQQKTQQKALLQQWEESTQRGFEMLWNEELGLYVDYDTVGKTHVIEPVSGGLIPILAGFVGKSEEKFRSTLQRWIAQDLPSVDVECEKYEEARYWRGPSWTIMNFLIYCGCVSCGWVEEAQAIRERSLTQIVEGGFYENFIPQKRQGGGGANFSWTAASYLYWLDSEMAFNFGENRIK